MAASQVAHEETPVSIVLQMSEQMQALAASGDWERIEDIAVRLRAALLDVPDSERPQLARSLKRSIDTVTAQASRARQTVSGKISELRRGQVAKKAYELR